MLGIRLSLSTFIPQIESVWGWRRATSNQLLCLTTRDLKG